MADPEELAVLSLCSGGAGLDVGLKLACPAARTVCYVEREGFAAANLVARMEAGELDAAPVWTDLRTFDGRAFRGVVDCVTAGYPCQPFSTAGRRGGASDPRHLWPEVARVVGECEPAYVFLENVRGHVSLGFREVCERLDGMGYDVATGLFSADEVGATHRRERLFILAHARHTTRPADDAPQAFDGTATECPRRGEAVGDGEGAGRIAFARQPFGEQTPFAGLGVHGFFPLGPEDFDRWDELLELRPWLAPATEPGVCGVVDGLAGDRAGYLRLLGNGVVPATAAVAFLHLSAALGVW